MTIHASIRTIAIALALLLAADVAFADSKVMGTVTTSAGDPIKGAKVRLEDGKTGRTLSMKTDKSGKFYRRGVPPSVYLLTIEKEQYTSHIVEDVKVQAGADREFDIILRSLDERQAELRAERIAQGDTYLEGFEAFQTGDYDAALKAADESIARNPDDPKGYDMKAKALVRMRRYAEAIPLLEKELSLPEPADDARAVLAGAVYNAGVVASREERADEALSLWLRAREMSYDEPTLERLIGQAYLQKADFVNARKHLAAYLEANPDAADAAEVKNLLAELSKLSGAASP